MCKQSVNELLPGVQRTSMAPYLHLLREHYPEPGVIKRNETVTTRNFTATEVRVMNEALKPTS